MDTSLSDGWVGELGQGQPQHVSAFSFDKQRGGIRNCFSDMDTQPLRKRGARLPWRTSARQTWTLAAKARGIIFLKKYPRYLPAYTPGRLEGFSSRLTVNLGARKPTGSGIDVATVREIRVGDFRRAVHSKRFLGPGNSVWRSGRDRWR